MSDEVLAERERCAKIAEFFLDKADQFHSDSPGWIGFTEACEEIAAKIRNGESINKPPANFVSSESKL